MENSIWQIQLPRIHQFSKVIVPKFKTAIQMKHIKVKLNKRPSSSRKQSILDSQIFMRTKRRIDMLACTKGREGKSRRDHSHLSCKNHRSNQKKCFNWMKTIKINLYRIILKRANSQQSSSPSSHRNCYGAIKLSLFNRTRYISLNFQSRSTSAKDSSQHMHDNKPIKMPYFIATYSQTGEIILVNGPSQKIIKTISRLSSLKARTENYHRKTQTKLQNRTDFQTR